MKIKDLEQIVKTERLTKELLLREVLPMHNASTYFRQKKEELFYDLETVSWCYDLDEKVVIYCFIRLWSEGKVRGSSFVKSFDLNSVKIISDYIKHYHEELEQAQQLLWQ